MFSFLDLPIVQNPINSCFNNFHQLIPESLRMGLYYHPLDYTVKIPTNSLVSRFSVGCQDVLWFQVIDTTSTQIQSLLTSQPISALQELYSIHNGELSLPALETLASSVCSYSPSPSRQPLLFASLIPTHLSGSL